MQEHLAEVAVKNYLSADVVELGVKLIRPRSMRFRAGQFVFFNIGGAFKAYSMTSVPADNYRLRFLIKLEPGGKGSTFIAGLKIGDRFEFTGPEGYFTVAAKKQNLCCLAAGIGIAPFLAMIPDQLAKKFTGQISLVYGAGSRAQIFYYQEFQKLAQRHKNFNFIPLAGQKITEYLKTYYSGHSRDLFYICGKPQAVAGAENLLKVLGHPEDKVRVESFLH